MRRPLLVIVGLLALAAGVPLLFDAPADGLWLYGQSGELR